MLVLSRKRGQRIIAGDIIIEVVDIRGDKVRIGVHAPKHVIVDREEVAIRRKEGESRERPME